MGVNQNVTVLIEWDTYGVYKDHEHAFLYEFGSDAEAEQFIAGARRLHAELWPVTDVMPFLLVSKW